MAGTITRGKVIRADLAQWDGKTATHTRIDATGGTLTGLAVGNEVDVLQVFGSGTNRTRATIATATNFINTTPVTLVFAPGTWTIDASLTIGANFTCHIPSGCVFSVDSGQTLTFSGDVHVEDPDTWYTGSGTVVVSREAAHGTVWHRTAAERTATVTPADLAHPPGHMLRNYSGSGDAETAIAAHASVGYGESRFQKGTYSIAAGPVTWANAQIRGEFGAVVQGNTGADTFDVNERFSVERLEFDTFDTALINTDTTDTPVEFSVTECEFHSSDNIPIHISAPITYARVLCSYFHDNMGQQIRFGQDTYSLQSGWEGALAAFNLFKDIESTNDASTAAVLSYAPFTKIIANHAKNIIGDADNETWFYYIKSPHGIIALNTGNGLQTSTTDTLYGINLKGTARSDTSGPNGYGAMALGNQLVGSNESSAFQMEAEEQALIANSAENFPRGIEQGSGVLTGNRVIGNRVRGTDTASTTAHGSTASGTKLLNALNMFYKFASGTSIGTLTTDTIDRIIQLGEHIEGINSSAGRGVDIVAATNGNITRAIVGDLTVRSFLNGVRIRGVTGATLHDLDISDIGSAPSVFDFTGSAQIVGRNVYRVTAQTTDATATNVHSFPVFTDAQTVHIKMTAIARRSDGTEQAVFERRCLGRREGGTTAVVEQSTATTLGNGVGTLEADGSIDFSASGSNIQCRVTGKAGTTYNWMCVFDFELL
jgi:hypothetical protein